jgi:hypothetical protein
MVQLFALNASLEHIKILMTHPNAFLAVKVMHATQMGSKYAQQVLLHMHMPVNALNAKKADMQTLLHL